MASFTNFFHMVLLIMLAISGQALSGRNVPNKSDDEDVKQPEFFLKSDRSFLIPGVGRVLLPPHVSKTDDEDVKQSKFFLKSDRSFLIPGVGRVLVPKHFSHVPPKKLPHFSIPQKKLPHVSIPSYTPNAGTGRYIPGGDDTLVPNPGYETPNPGRGRSVPAVAAHP